MLVLEAALVRLCERLAAALAAGRLATAHLTLHLECDDGTRHLRALRCWPPLALRASLERVARALLAEAVSGVPVMRLTLEARGLCAATAGPTGPVGRQSGGPDPAAGEAGGCPRRTYTCPLLRVLRAAAA